MPEAEGKQLKKSKEPLEGCLGMGSGWKGGTMWERILYTTVEDLSGAMLQAGLTSAWRKRGEGVKAP